MGTVELHVTLMHNFHAASPLHFSMITCDVKNNNGQHYIRWNTVYQTVMHIQTVDRGNGLDQFHVYIGPK